jgi:predicted ester cyclase
MADAAGRARAAAPGIVERYLAALVAQDWTALASTLAAGVERIGPYGDVYRGRDAYVAFLAETVGALSGYELRVERLIAGAATIVAELREAVDTPAGRRTTAEAVVFDVGPAGTIVHVAVYLRKSVTA